MTAALEGGEWSAARPGRTLPPGKDPVPIVQEAGWAPGPVWTAGKSRPHRDSITDRPARSQSLYLLSYPAYNNNNNNNNNGRHPYDLSQQYVDIEASNKWLTNADFFAETEGFITEIQDQVILTRNYKKYILKQPDTDELCRRCGRNRRQSNTLLQHVRN